MSEFTGLPRKFARINATADGDNVVIAAVGNDEYIVVLGYAINVNAAGVTTLQDTTASPNIAAVFEFVDGGGANYAGNDECPAFALAKGTGLEVSNAAGVDTTGHVTYVVKR